jgi:recombinational DNA repair protein (RecF pathway)
MHEYVAQAVILDKEPFQEYDNRISFFTEKFGKLTGKAVSTRKVKSKLAAHLEPGNFVNLRFVEKRNLQIVDGLKAGELRTSAPDLYRLHQVLPEGEPEADLWRMLRENRFTWREALKILGWDPTGSLCRCGKTSAAFYVPRQDMFCKTCAAEMPLRDLIFFT